MIYNNISGFDAQQVVEVLYAIINEKAQFTMNKTFYLMIYSSPEYNSGEIDEFFRHKARPTKHQPGNGIVFLRRIGDTNFKDSKSKSMKS